MRIHKLCLTLAFLMVITVVLQGGCTSRSVKQTKSNTKVVIGFAMDTLQQERWYVDRTDFVAAAQKLGASVKVTVANDSTAGQIDQVQGLLNEGINVLVFVPHDDLAEASVVSLAKKHGVKVISYDRMVRNANVALYISFDNVKVGELQASTMLQAVPKGNYVIINGSKDDYNSTMINGGMKKVLDPNISAGNIKIVKEIYASDWMADEAADCIQNLLNSNIKIDGVIAENDSLAGGVINQLAENQMLSKVPVVGMDADLDACQRVVEGQQLMTVYKPINSLAQSAAQFAVELAKGEKLNVKDTINNGKYTVPYYTIQPIAVTKDNMLQTVVKDNFHTKDQVYMNVSQSK